MESPARPHGAAPGAAIVIAGGKGERLRPLTNTRPKCLVEVAGRPILDWQLASLERAGVERVAIVGYYLFEAIEAFVAGRAGHLRVDLVREERPLGRGGAIKLGYRELGTGGSVLALNGDILCDLDLAALEALRVESDTAAAILAVPLRSPYGILELERSRVIAFREKPVLEHWINGGIYALGQEALELFPDEGDHEDSTFPDLASQGRLSALRFSDAWRSVDSLKDLREAEELFAVGAFGPPISPRLARLLTDAPMHSHRQFDLSPDARRTEKPWGYEVCWTPTSKPYVGKLIHINAGARLSLQIHDQKSESWYLVSGRAKVIWEQEPDGALLETELESGAGYNCEAGQRHRLIGVTACDIIEASTPEVGNTLRLEDDYSRADESLGRAV